MSKIYVQHISGKGEKWRVKYSSPNDWAVNPINDDAREYCFPKSEYILCEAPIVWREVTEECELRIDALQRQQIWHYEECIDGSSGYQFRKVKEPRNRWAFIVEKREPEE